MYAIVRDSSRQFKVTEGQKLVVEERPVEVGQTITFPEVLLYSAGEDVRIGTPVLSGVSVTGEIVRRLQGDKLIVFKRKRRKTTRRKVGHRQQYVEVLIREIKAD